MKKLSIVIVVIALLIFTNVAVFALDFSDVPSSHWAYTYVNDLSNKGIINGYEDGTFRPSNTITKAEYIKLLDGCVASKSEMASMIAQMEFSEHWYDSFVNYSNRVLSTKYVGDELKSTVNRIEMATMLVDYANYAGLSVEASSSGGYTEVELEELFKLGEGNLTYSDIGSDGYIYVELKRNNDVTTEIVAETELPDYEDIHSLSQKDQDTIIYASQLGLIAGYEDDTFRPYNIMTRAEVATIIYRLIDSINKL